MMNDNEPKAPEQTTLDSQEAPQTEEVSADEKLRAEAQALRQEMLYMRAEYDNYKKRILKEQEMSIKFANEKMIRDLMGAVDLFTKASEHAQVIKNKFADSKEILNFTEGVELTFKELLSVFHKHGVVLVGEVGEVFDPNIHEAVSNVQVEEPQANKVATVFQKGCVFQGRTLTPAKVVVGISKNA